MVSVNPVVCIAGPTASGKSALAVQIAARHNGEVVNADALQVYRDLRILSARPSQDEMGGIPHHLFGHIDGAQRYNVGRWLDEALPLIIDILARGRMPVIAGGTGLYFKALTQGLAGIPEPSAEGKRQAATLFEQGIEALRNRAAVLDPVAFARILGDDPQRLIRLVEVALGTDKPLSAWQADTRPVVPSGYWRGLVLLPERAGLYDKINARFDAMTDNGAIEEVRALMARGLEPMLPVMKAIGVRELAAIAAGQMKAEEGLEAARRETRRFAKRQYTWFRGQAKTWESAVTRADCERFGESLRVITV